MSNTPIELKGSSFTLSVVHLHNAQPEVIRQALEDKIAQAPAFLKNAPVVVNIAALETPFDWPEILKAMQTTGLRIMGVSGCKDATLKTQIGRSGIPLLTEGKEKVIRTEPERPAPVEQKVIPPQPVPVAAAQTRIINTPVRSGQRIYAPGSDLIVTSHVSAGAELIADGNIHIYGMMRGRALAGAAGNRDAQIFCTHLGAELVSIAGVYWLSEQIPADFSGKAARLCLTDGVLSVQPLD